MTDQQLNDEFQQRAEWRERLIEAVICRSADDETLVDMLMAAFDQSHSDGLQDAAAVCDHAGKNNGEAGRAARTLAGLIRELDRMNRSDKPT